MRIYLDACCLLRPWDDQSQPRIRLESEAVCAVLELCAAGAHRWVSSEVVEAEMLRDPDDDRRSVMASMLRFADERLTLDEQAIQFAESLSSNGLGSMDALHVAIAYGSGHF